ncbi:MAG: RDD family protein [Halobacteriota archaeon]
MDFPFLDSAAAQCTKIAAAIRVDSTLVSPIANEATESNSAASQEKIKKVAFLRLKKEVKYLNDNQCAQCGTPASPGAKYCESCGAPLAAPAAQPARATSAPAPGYQAPRSYVPHIAPPYQGVAIRFVAILIDTIIIAIIGGILSVPFNALTVITNSASGTVTLSPAGAVGGLVSLAVFVLYFTLLEGHYGQTVGKMAVKIKVVRETDGAPIDYSEAAVRTILRVLDFVPYIVPYLLGAILIWSSEEKQRLGDRVAHTVVIKA